MMYNFEDIILKIEFALDIDMNENLKYEILRLSVICFNGGIFWKQRFKLFVIVWICLKNLLVAYF